MKSRAHEWRKRWASSKQSFSDPCSNLISPTKSESENTTKPNSYKKLNVEKSNTKTNVKVPVIEKNFDAYETERNFYGSFDYDTDYDNTLENNLLTANSESINIREKRLAISTYFDQLSLHTKSGKKGYSKSLFSKDKNLSNEKSYNESTSHIKRNSLPFTEPDYLTGQHKTRMKSQDQWSEKGSPKESGSIKRNDLFTNNSKKDENNINDSKDETLNGSNDIDDLNEFKMKCKYSPQLLTRKRQSLPAVSITSDEYRKLHNISSHNYHGEERRDSLKKNRMLLNKNIDHGSTFKNRYDHLNILSNNSNIFSQKDLMSSSNYLVPQAIPRRKSYDDSINKCNNHECFTHSYRDKHKWLEKIPGSIDITNDKLFDNRSEIISQPVPKIQLPEDDNNVDEKSNLMTVNKTLINKKPYLTDDQKESTSFDKDELKSCVQELPSELPRRKSRTGLFDGIYQSFSATSKLRLVHQLSMDESRSDVYAELAALTTTGDFPEGPPLPYTADFSEFLPSADSRRQKFKKKPNSAPDSFDSDRQRFLNINPVPYCLDLVLKPATLIQLQNEKGKF